jgi:hypothetical protein
MIKEVANLISGYNPFTSGMTEEDISGIRAVCVSQSGNIRIAMASISGRMPAIGVVVANVLSGIQVDVRQFGTYAASSGMIELSGYGSQLLYVGRSGQIVTASGSFNSGGLLSGDITQPIGIALQTFSGAGSPQIFSVQMAASLPFVDGLVTSGNIASGQIGQMHLSSGAINSGHIANNAILSGSIASGQIGSFHLASGAVTSGDVGDNAIVSGSIASGQIGRMHLSSGAINSGHIADNAVVSGSIASGQLSTYAISSGSIIHRANSTALAYSGFYNTLITSEPISGIKAVCIDTTMSGLSVRIAMAAVSGRRPAIGIVADNVASGIQCNIITQGILNVGSGLIASGFWPNRRLWVGRSGDVITLSGAFASGGFASGDITQAIGVLQYNASGGTSGTYWINVSMDMRVASSGLVFGGVAANNFIW